MFTLLQCFEFIWKNVARFQTEKLSLFVRLFGKESKRKQKKKRKRKRKRSKQREQKKQYLECKKENVREGKIDTMQ